MRGFINKIKLLTVGIFVLMLSMATTIVHAANDSFLNATNIVVNTVVTDNIAERGDENYYKISLPTDGCVSLTFNHEELESSYNEWVLYLYTESQEEIYEMYSRGSVTSTNSAYIGLPMGTYYIKVESSDYYNPETVSYQLIVNYSTKELWETEFNDGFTTADVLAVNSSIKGTIRRQGDEDYYKVKVPSDGRIMISFGHQELESSGDEWLVYLYDENRNKMYEFGVKGDSLNTYSCNLGVPAGNYYIKVECSYYYHPETVQYQLEILHWGTMAWETEDNDGYLSADVIHVNEGKKGTICNYSDKDYYKLKVAKSGYINIGFIHDIIDSDYSKWELSILDSNRNLIEEAYIIGSKNKTSMGMQYFTKGTYYIMVESAGTYNYSDVIYTLKVNYTTPKVSLNMNKVKSSSKKKLTVSWYKQSRGVSGYQIVTATDKGFKMNKKCVNVSRKKSNYTFSNLKSKKTYYVKMRSYITVDGKNYYGSYCKTMKVKVK